MRIEQRLRRRSDFAAVYRNGRVQRHELLVVRVLPNHLPVSRFGFVAGKAIGGAVARNRTKRRLREAARMMLVRDGFDVVVGARAGAAAASFDQIRVALLGALKGASVLEREQRAKGVG
jgi:ribonuclease P protein component